MATITIEINVPDASVVTIDSQEAQREAPASTAVRDYWDYLSDNGRRVYTAAAKAAADWPDGFTMADIARELDVEVPSARSMLSSTGRAARRWRREHGTEAPIALVKIRPYGWNVRAGAVCHTYALPAAEEINSIAG